jgi:microsomal prostaglandin-E synthase 2
MLTLYQFKSCPFCGKVRAFLNFAKIPHDLVEVTPFSMKELDFTDHKKVPVLRDGETVVVESAAIVRYLNETYAHLLPNPQDEEWAKWVDNTLVHYLPPLIHPNIRTSFRNLGKVMGAKSGNPVKQFIVRLMGSLVMPRVAVKMKLKHNIRDTEAEFHAAIDHWVKQGLAGKAFFGGETPSLIDTSVYGVLSSTAGMGIIEQATTHNPAFGQWYEATHALAA